VAQVGDEQHVAPWRLRLSADVDEQLGFVQGEAERHAHPLRSECLRHRAAIGADGIKASVDHELGRIDRRTMQVSHVDVLPLHRLWELKTVTPTEIVPVIHVPGQRHDICSCAQLSDGGLRGGTGAAPLRCEELHDQGPLLRTGARRAAESHHGGEASSK